MTPTRMLFLVATLALLGGCASSRSVVNPTTEATANPTQGVAVRIDQIEDARRFEAAPRSPDRPSLSGNDISNPALTSRAVARKRNSYGMAMGDVLLPEGQTASQLIGNAVTSGFRQAGYRVVSRGEPGYDQAVPVTARINEFWSWFSPGFASVTISNRAAIDLNGPLPALNNGVQIKNETSESMMAVFEEDWKIIISKGLRDLSEKIRAKLTQQ